jgi:hypothetical protein
VSEPRRLVDPTEAVRRAYLVGKYGQGDKDRIPVKLRFTLLQGATTAVLFVAELVVWWALIGRNIDPTTVGFWQLAVMVVVAVVAGRLVRHVRVDGRSAVRAGRATVSHRVRSRGRSSTPWQVNGRVNPYGPRRMPKPTPYTIPAGDMGTGEGGLG